jgi:hypothetical protein
MLGHPHVRGGRYLALRTMSARSPQLAYQRRIVTGRDKQEREITDTLADSQMMSATQQVQPAARLATCGSMLVMFPVSRI